MITVRKLTDADLLHEVIEFAYKLPVSTMTLAKAYHQEHSIIRTQMFIIKMGGIPTKASVHFVRHAAVGQFHLVSTNRGDLKASSSWDEADNWDEAINRTTPVNHVMILNAGHLIDMAKTRLCSKAERETRETMEAIKEGVSLCDPQLATYMVPTCFYRGGICPEPKGCGRNVEALMQVVGQVPEHVYRNARNNKAIADKGEVINNDE